MGAGHERGVGVDGDLTEMRERIMAAAIRCVERSGVKGFSLEDVAASAGVSRTTIYRNFPGGRSQLLEQTATWEVARFWRRLAEAVADLPTLEERLATGLVIGAKLIARSSILANLLDSEMQELVEAVHPSEPLIHGVIRDYLRELLEAERDQGRLVESVDVEFAADYLTRMTLSWLGSSGSANLTDTDTARHVVRTQFLAGIVVA